MANVSRAIRELIKIDIKNGLSQNLIMKKYDIKKKNIIRDIKAELEDETVENCVGQVVGLEVGHVVNQGIEPIFKVGQEVSPKVRHKKEVVENRKETTGVQKHDSVGLTTNEYINNNIDILTEMIKDYKKLKVVQSSTLNIELPIDDDTNYKTSIRVNKVVWDKFKIYCNDHKQFKQKELLSKALLDLMKNYK